MEGGSAWSPCSPTPKAAQAKRTSVGSKRLVDGHTKVLLHLPCVSLGTLAGVRKGRQNYRPLLSRGEARLHLRKPLRPELQVLTA